MKMFTPDHQQFSSNYESDRMLDVGDYLLTQSSSNQQSQHSQVGEEPVMHSPALSDDDISSDYSEEDEKEISFDDSSQTVTQKHLF
jgi:hypothetical protein